MKIKINPVRKKTRSNFPYRLSHSLLIGPIRLQKCRISRQTTPHSPDHRVLIILCRRRGVDPHPPARHDQLFPYLPRLKESTLIKKVFPTPLFPRVFVLRSGDLAVRSDGIQDGVVVPAPMSEFAPRFGYGVALLADVEEELG